MNKWFDFIFNFFYKYYFLRKLAKISSIFQVKNEHEKKGDLLLNVKWKLHFHRVNTTQLLRLPCTHLSEPLEHAEGGTPSQAERKNRRNRESKTGRKSILEDEWCFKRLCAQNESWECVRVCVHLRVCASVSVWLTGLSSQM